MSPLDTKNGSHVLNEIEVTCFGMNYGLIRLIGNAYCLATVKKFRNLLFNTMYSTTCYLYALTLLNGLCVKDLFFSYEMELPFSF